MKKPLSEKRIKRLASFALLAAALIWGSSFVILKSALDVIPTLHIIAMRFSVATVILAILLRKQLHLLNKEYIKRGLLLGIFLFMAYYFQTTGLKYTTPGKNAFLTSAYVIIVPFFEWILIHQRPNRYVWCSAVLAIVGIGLLSLNIEGAVNIGDVFTLICGFGYAAHMIFIAKFSKEYDPVLLTLIQFFTVALLAWIPALIFDGLPQTAYLSGGTVLSILYLSIVCTLVCYVLQNTGQKYVSPSTASLLLSFESVFGFLFSAVFGDEVLSAKTIIGCILIFLAVIIQETEFAFLKGFGKRKNNGSENII